MARITAELKSGTAVSLSNGRHTWTADEPPEAGGSDAGPTPYEILLGALAACTCITLALYCRHKGIELRRVTAWYEYDRIHADDCEDCDRKPGGFVDRITSRVKIEGTFTEAQRERLAQIVSRCPVHKTLEAGVKLTDQVEFG
jgi:putative redox protein